MQVGIAGFNEHGELVSVVSREVFSKIELRINKKKARSKRKTLKFQKRIKWWKIYCSSSCLPQGIKPQMPLGWPLYKIYQEYERKYN